MKKQFSEVPKVEIPRSSFNRSHGLKTTFDGGFLVPILIDEILPGDSISCRMTGFARLSTPIHPVMDNLFMTTHFFFCPTRLLWTNFQKFMGERDPDPDSSIDYTIPIRATGGTNIGSLYDYFGLPVNQASGIDHNVLPMRMYYKTWNQWFRHEQLQDSLPELTDDGPDTAQSYSLQRRNKRFDYFTSCLPWPQLGDAIDLPLGSTAPVQGIGFIDGSAIPTINQDVWETDATAHTPYAEGVQSANIASMVAIKGESAGDTPEIYADLTNATAASINDLREAFAIQRFQEKEARGGSRYTEIIRSMFGVSSPDARLQRVEFLGGGESPVQINSVPQTSQTDTTAQGTLAAYGTASLSGHGFTKSFTEHGYVLGLVSVRADLTYQQGLARMWSRQTRYDFYWPGLAHLGEQEVLNGEIYWQDTAADQDVFGYQERYAEYRYKNSKICGEFRSESGRV